MGGTPRVELVVTGGPSSGRRWDLGDGSYTLGRDRSSDVMIDDRSLSRHHLNLVVAENGVRVADAGSSNGSAIDGESLAPNVYRALREQDESGVG